MIDIIKQQTGLNLDELYAKYKQRKDSGVADAANDELTALTLAAYFCSRVNALESVKAVIQTAFVIGYAAGRDAPDLSVFEDALREKT